MNIQFEHQTETEGTVSVSISPTDYTELVNKKVKEFSRQANVPGFRKGKVPEGMIRKLYGQAIFTEEINTLASKSLYDFIEEKKLNVIGNPIPDVEKLKTVDWEKQGDFRFEFLLGMVPTFSLPDGKEKPIKKYSITVTQEVIDDTIDDLRWRYRNTDVVEVSTEGCSLFGNIKKKEEGEVKSSYLHLSNVLPEAVSQFVGKKVGDKIVFDLKTVMNDVEAIKPLLNVEDEEAQTASGEYEFEITMVRQNIRAELDEAFFKNVFKDETITTSEQFFERLKADIQKTYDKEATTWYQHELEDYLIKHTNIQYSADFLKKWLKHINENNTDEMIEKDFDRFIRGWKWGMIENKIAKEQNISITEDDLVDEMVANLRGYLSGYTGMMPDEQLRQMAINLINRQDQENNSRERIAQAVFRKKLMSYLETTITPQITPISLADFKHMVEHHQH